MLYKFGVFEFDGDTKELRKNGRFHAIEPQPAKALALLLARAGDIITREELRDAVWGKDTHVDFDRGLAYCVSQVRTALGDSGDNPRFVQTIPKRGFKFIAPITTAAQPNLTTKPGGSRGWVAALAVTGLIALIATALVAVFVSYDDPLAARVVIAVSIFDNETGNAEYDRRVTVMSDAVVETLTKLDPRIAVIGNAAILRQPRNIRNLRAVAENIHADYVLLGQLQQAESGLRFITHFIRLSDEAHLRANRLQHFEPNLDGLEELVVEEFVRATREHVLNALPN